MRDIQVNIFDPRSMQVATHQLESYLADLQDRANRICERLASIGRVRAEIVFSNAIYDGVNDVSVTAEPITNGYAVRASGNAVMFIEFGAGVYYNGTGSYPGNLEPGVVGIGQYGQGRGSNDWWLYRGSPGNAGGVQSTIDTSLTITHGNPPAAAMYEAQQECIRQIETVVNEVFNT